jgi:hypothetical protein
MTGRIYSPRRHEDSRREKRLWRCATWAVVQSTLACILPDVLHAKARRRKESWDKTSIRSCLDCRGDHSCRTLPSLFLLRALRIFVVKNLVAAGGCSRHSVVSVLFVDHGTSRKKTSLFCSASCLVDIAYESI